MKRGPKPTGKAKTELQRQQEYQRRLKAAASAWARSLLTEEDRKKADRLELLIAEANQISEELNASIINALKADNDPRNAAMITHYEGATQRVTFAKTDLIQ